MLSVRLKKIILALLLFPFAANVDLPAGSEEINRQSGQLIKAFVKYHYRTRAIDDAFAKECKSQFIQSLDPSGMLFTENDRTLLLNTRCVLRDTGSCDVNDLAGKSASLFRTRLKESIAIIESIGTVPLNYREKATVRFGDSAVVYAADQNALTRKWRDRIIFRVLDSFWKNNYSGKPLVAYEALFAAQEPALRKKAVTAEVKFIRRLLDVPRGFDRMVNDIFLDTLARRFDPHSSYMSPDEKAGFDNALSSKALEYGVTFTVENGAIVVERITPGGPAWKSSKIRKGDLLLEVYLSADKKKYDAQELDVDELYSLITSSRNNSMILTLRKKNGAIEKVSLRKEKMDVEENLIMSYVLAGSRKIGFISLPSFYGEWDSPGAPACANDVAKEIIKLKRDGVEGIIIDLRDNGGGSLSESVQLSGLFIDEGPMCIQADRDGKNYIIKDPSRGTVYDGALLVLVNGYSASASEFFTATMKDYGRAVVVGGSTYGKASSQVILPLVDDLEKANERSYKNNKAGYIKLTTSLYYGLTGKTHQVSGIIPDVVLPDPYGGSGKRERDQMNILPAGSVNKKVVYAKTGIPQAYLSGASARRISSSALYREMGRNGALFKKRIYDVEEYNLEISGFIAARNADAAVIESIDRSRITTGASFKAANTTYDEEIILFDTVKKGINKELLDEIGSDPWIHEAYNIIIDYIRKK